jgi:segregation and condensation protein A
MTPPRRPAAGWAAARARTARARTEPGRLRRPLPLPLGPGASPRGGGGRVRPAEAAGAVGDGRFTVRLANFEGPFDLLLQLISKHKPM